MRASLVSTHLYEERKLHFFFYFKVQEYCIGKHTLELNRTQKIKLSFEFYSELSTQLNYSIFLSSELNSILKNSSSIEFFFLQIFIFGFKCCFYKLNGWEYGVRSIKDTI